MATKEEMQNSINELKGVVAKYEVKHKEYSDCYDKLYNEHVTLAQRSMKREKEIVEVLRLLHEAIEKKIESNNLLKTTASVDRFEWEYIREAEQNARDALKAVDKLFKEMDDSVKYLQPVIREGFILAWINKKNHAIEEVTIESALQKEAEILEKMHQN